CRCCHSSADYFGLMAVPYIDSSVEGSGYYSFSKRKFASVAFLGGFFFWVALIIIGTFFRGQNWHFYGLFENRALVKSEALHLVNLSDIVWTQLLNVQKPDHWLAREFFGIALLLFYLAILPLLVRKSGKKRNLVTLLLLFSAAGVAIKIFLRLAFDIKYVLYLPEYVLNI
ncbi:MAG: hypothetical protein ACE5FU_13095, partial [Nitrospinota bacterium]